MPISGKFRKGLDRATDEAVRRTKWAASKLLTDNAEFIPGHVVKVITDRHSSDYRGSDRNINAIKAYPHGTLPFKHRNLSKVEAPIWFPLLRGVTDVPTQGDMVLLTRIGGTPYYLGPINTLNSPNTNVDPFLVMDTDVNRTEAQLGTSAPDLTMKERYDVNPAHNFNPGMRRLQTIPNPKLDNQALKNKKQQINLSDYPVGDLMLEGRNGNSIRLGSRGGYPNLIISNGRMTDNAVETMFDGCILSMTVTGTLSENFLHTQQVAPQWVPSSNGSPEEESPIPVNPRSIEWGDTAGSQLYTSTDKITINSRTSPITLSSGNSIIMGASDKIDIKARSAVNIDGSNIYLGSDFIVADDGTFMRGQDPS